MELHNCHTYVFKQRISDILSANNTKVTDQ